jgi:hypothetical protein
MLELLKRFEQENIDDPFTYPESSDEDGPVDDLERRLAGIDLGELFTCMPSRIDRRWTFVESASADKIWAALTPEERSHFTRAVQDPSSELAKTLLTSPDLVDDIPAPWWTSPLTTPPANTPAPRPARPPELISIPKSLVAAPTPASAFPLAYNLVAIL